MSHSRADPRIAGGRRRHKWLRQESEHTDGHTRYCLIRGGSSFRLAKDASFWYFENGPQDADHACKLILGGAAADRFSTVGFRCVVDLC